MNLRIRSFSQHPQNTESRPQAIHGRLTDEEFDALLDLNPHELERPELLACFNHVVDALKAERAKVAELEAVIRTDPDYAPWARLEATEAQLTALPKWAQSSESKGQFYRKSIQEMAALREQLTELREGLEGLQKYDFTPDGMLTEFCGGCWVATDDIQSLLTQTTPTVNSDGEGGEV